MMDFPSSPTNGQVFGAYTYNGSGWVVTAPTGFVEIDGSTPFTGKQSFPASATGAASANFPHGTAPTSPVNGDFWTTTAGVFVRLNGVTAQLLTSAGATMTGRLVIAGNDATRAGFNIPQALVNPTSPVAGDFAHNTDGNIYWHTGAAWRRIIYEADAAFTAKANLAGATFTGTIYQKASGSVGGMQIVQGDASSTGHIGFLWSNNVRCGYINADASYMRMESEVGRTLLFVNGGGVGTIFLNGSEGILHSRGNSNTSRINFERSDGAAWGHIRYEALGSPVTGLIMVNQNGYYWQLREDGFILTNGAISAPSVAATNFYGTYNPPSDARLKDDLGSYTLGLEELLALDLRRYRYKPETKLGGQARVGVIAQDAEKTPLGPLLVHQTETTWGDISADDMRVVSPDVLIFTLINAVRELHGRVQELEAKLPK